MKLSKEELELVCIAIQNSRGSVGGRKYDGLEVELRNYITDLEADNAALREGLEELVGSWDNWGKANKEMLKYPTRELAFKNANNAVKRHKRALSAARKLLEAK